MLTKAEVYSKLIQIQKKHGQGLAGVVKVLSGEASLWAKYLDELIDEGLVEVFDDGSTIGHPESARWYMPTKGYNLWKDGIENGDGSRFSSSKFLTHIRLYLGVLDNDAEPDHVSEDDNLRRYLSPSAQLLLQDPKFMKSYSEWLIRNHDALEEMKNLSMLYEGPTPAECLIDGDIEWIVSRGWFEDNLLVSECIEKSIKTGDNDKKRLELTKQMVGLMEKSEKHEEELKKYKDEVIEINDAINRRERVNNLLMSLNQSSKIQDELSDIIK